LPQIIVAVGNDARALLRPAACAARGDAECSAAIERYVNPFARGLPTGLSGQRE
jgi:hypothetical protein